MPEELKRAEAEAKAREARARWDHERALAEGDSRQIRLTAKALDEATDLQGEVIARIQREAKRAAGLLCPQAAAYFTKKVRARITKPLEIHFHSDFGMGVANTINAVMAGGEVIHTTVLGIGERAGNTPMEETVLALLTMYGIDVGIDYSKMNELSQLVRQLSGVQVPSSRPFVGDGVRWGGCFCSYYIWLEGVGPRTQRKPMVNQLWGGISNNQVGTHEFVDFGRRVGADLLLVVNFESDGRKYWAVSPKGDIRSGNAQEAAEWVDYCNNPSSALRRQHGFPEPYGVKLWQIGNETSSDPNGFKVGTAAKKTLEFAKAMREADRTIALVGWGDSGWGERMAEIAGEELQYLAFHNSSGPGGPDSPLRGCAPCVHHCVCARWRAPPG